MLAEAIALGEQALNESGTFDEEYEAMQKAYVALQKALAGYDEYLRQLAAEGKLSDMTFLLQNPDFSQGGQGWSGTGFTAAAQGVAEHYYKTFDFYQQLSGLPNGRYRVEVQSFYRAGGKEDASAAHKNGSETINALFYANNEEKSVCSLYDADIYTVSPYTYPDNVTEANAAFNTHDLYHNTLECVVTDGTLKLGIRSNQMFNYDWCCFDNFKLTYLDAETGIQGVLGDKKEGNSSPIYRLDGVKLGKKPAQGIYIQDGKKHLNK